MARPPRSVCGSSTERMTTGFPGEFFQDGADAAGAVNIFHMSFAGRADFAEVGSTRRNLVDTLQRIVYTRLSRQGQCMQYSVRGAAHRHVESKSIIDAFPVDNLPGSEISLKQAHDGATSFARKFLTRLANCKVRSIAREGKTKRFHQAVHRVRGK